MKNKQINFWICNFKYFLSPKSLKTYMKLKKDFNQELFEKYANDYVNVFLKAANINYQVKGKENVLDQPCLYIFNHNSMFDSFFSYPVITKHSYFIAHEFEYSKKIPLIGNFMSWANAIFVKRSSLRAGLKSIELGKEQLKIGNNLCIFAEGELTKLVKEKPEDIVGPFHSGSFKPAKDIKVPVIPVAIKGSDKIHTSSSFLGRINSGTIEVYIGKPIYDFVEDNNVSTKEVSEKARAEIINLLK